MAFRSISDDSTKQLLAMETDKRIFIAFDLYDTLLSAASISKRLADFIPTETAEPLAFLWRRYQLPGGSIVLVSPSITD